MINGSKLDDLEVCYKTLDRHPECFRLRPAFAGLRRR